MGDIKVINTSGVVADMVISPANTVGAPLPAIKLPEEKKEINPLLQMGGRPCMYCERPEHYQKIAEEFLVEYINPPKPKIPFLEDLCLKLDIDEDTISRWATKTLKNSDDLEHPAFYGVYRKVKILQKSALKKRVLGRYQPRGAMFLLAADHKVVEETKQTLAGDKDAPVKLEIEIIEEKPKTE